MHKPKGITMNSNSLKGVMIAIFGISSVFTGILWYARTTSIDLSMQHEEVGQYVCDRVTTWYRSRVEPVVATA